ncbi:MAG: DUF177 domain-containing protein [Rhizobiaceae bacterium]|nr:DUF177 domain-containing protein [Rhizobiaceae bacterium]
MPVEIVADQEQRAELAQIHGLERVDALSATLMVSPWKRNGVKVTGTVTADVVQTCVVTLEPLESHIAEDVETVFLPEDSKLGREGFGLGGEIVIDAEGPDSPEIFSGDTIDVGALAEEFFGLGIDPYPRKRGADVQRTVEPKEMVQENGGSFADKLREALPKK